MQSIDEVLKERSHVDELTAKLRQEEQASRAKDQQLQAHIEQTANEMRVPTANCLPSQQEMPPACLQADT